MENSELVKEIEVLKAERDALASYNITILECLSDIQSQCIGEITMSFKLDPEFIGRQIYEATGLTYPELLAKVRQGGAE